MQRGDSAQRLVECQGHGQRVVEPETRVLRRNPDRQVYLMLLGRPGPEDCGDLVGDGVVSTVYLRQLTVTERDFQCHVYGAQYLGHIRVTNDLRRRRIVVEVVLLNRSPADALLVHDRDYDPGHHDEFFHVLGDSRLHGVGNRQVRNRAQSNNRYLAGVCHDVANYEIGRMFVHRSEILIAVTQDAFALETEHE